MNITEGLTFDDVLLIPKYSEIKSRKDVDLSIKIDDFKFSIPIVNANMKHIASFDLLKAIVDLGGLALMHRFEDNQIELFTKGLEVNKNWANFCGASVGVKKEDYKLVDELAAIGVRIICIDIAHADSEIACKMTEYIAKTYPTILLISGNVSTTSGANRLYDHGAKVIKVGQGSGSLCSTRIMTGNGVCQLSAIEECYNNAFNSGNRKYYVISDGGIKNSGDICKALCFSDMVMIGSLFAGCEETQTETITINGESFKAYEGSSTFKTNNIEGIKTLVKTKGLIKNIIQMLMENIQSGCSYQGVNNLEDLKKDPMFIKISNAGIIESHPTHQNINI